MAQEKKGKESEGFNIKLCIKTTEQASLWPYCKLGTPRAEDISVFPALPPTPSETHARLSGSFILERQDQK